MLQVVLAEACQPRPTVHHLLLPHTADHHTSTVPHLWQQGKKNSSEDGTETADETLPLT